jgi:CDP-2,3-bis-(O-geranylgeranyl)-sn-glycerol synthase
MNDIVLAWAWKIIVTLVYFFPAYLANMFPVIFLKTDFLKKYRKPLDMRYMLWGKRLLGENKTFYGIIMAVLGGSLGALISVTVVVGIVPITGKIFSPEGWYVFYYAVCVMSIGGYIGLGAILGDVVKSFFKRRIGIASGKSLFLFDQIDFIIGAWLAILFLNQLILFNPDWTYFWIALIVTPFLHLGANLVAYLLKLKKVWW